MTQGLEWVFGKIAGHRGAHGELTVRVFDGDGPAWTGLARVRIGAADGAWYDIESSRGYKDRLVLKLAGVDDASAAAALKGREVRVEEAEAPQLEDGRFHAAQLIGLQVVDGEGRTLGRVEDLVSAGGAEVLVIVSERGEEILVPMTPQIVTEVDRDAGVLRVAPPEGLIELNRRASPRDRA